jgi:hypothetical protein
LAHFDCVDSGAQRSDHADDLVTGGVRQFDERVASVCGVRIGTADTGYHRMNEDFAGGGLRCGRLDDAYHLRRHHDAPHPRGDRAVREVEDGIGNGHAGLQGFSW